MRPDYCPMINEPCQSLCDKPCSAHRLKVTTTPKQPAPVWELEWKQIAEDLRFHGLTLVKTVTGYAVLKLGAVQAQASPPAAPVQQKPKFKTTLTDGDPAANGFETVPRDCEHGRQVGKCADCDVAELEQENRLLRARNERLEASHAEWISKTDWVQESAQPRELGMHRLDVLRQRIDRLEGELREKNKGSA